MIDFRFFPRPQGLSLEELARVGEADLRLSRTGSQTAKTVFFDVSTLQEAQSSTLSLYHHKKYKSMFQQSSAGACFAPFSAADEAPETTSLLLSKSPQRSFALALSALYPETEGDVEFEAIHPTAQVGEGTQLGHGVVLQKNVKIGRHCRIGAQTVIGVGVEIGDHTWIGAHVTLSHTLIGDKVRVYPGARIGQAGFGFAMDERGFVSIPQLGRVLIGNHVEIGANTTIDRGSLRDTVIGPGCRLDNLVMIGHNVVLGPGCVLVAQVGIAGSTTFGKNVIAAGQAGFVGHLNVGDGARIGAQSGVMKDVAPGDHIFGTPGAPLKQHMRQLTTLKQLSRQNSLSEEKKA